MAPVFMMDKQIGEQNRVKKILLISQKGNLIWDYQEILSVGTHMAQYQMMNNYKHEW